MAKILVGTKFKALPEVAYMYVGDGFIPGLPKMVTPSEAEHMGVSELLQEAIINGSYVTREHVSEPADQEKE